MAKTLKIRRGNKADLPVLEEGELGLTLDEKKMYVGTGSENIALANEQEINQGVHAADWVKLNSDNATYKIACIKDLCIAVNPINGMSYISRDGWKSHDTSTITDLKNVTLICGGQGKIIAVVGNTNSYKVSTNGTTWAANTLPAGLDWNSLSYANDKFILLSSTTTFYYSTNGTTWTTGTLPTAKNWKGVVYGNGVYIAYEDDGENYLISSNGITWTAKTLPAIGPGAGANPKFKSLIYADGRFIGGGGRNLYEGAIFVSSADGGTWTRNYVDLNYTYVTGCYGNRFYILIGKNYEEQNQKILLSSDGIRWAESIYNNKFNDAGDFLYWNGTFLLSCADGVYTNKKISTDCAMQLCYSQMSPALITGSYTGNGASSHAIDLGFRPTSVIISQTKVYNAAAPVILRRDTSTYVVTSSGGTPVEVGSIGTAGFVVQGNTPATNQNSTEYTYIAFR